MRAVAQAPAGPEESVLLALVREPHRVLDVGTEIEADDFSSAASAALFATIAGMVEAAEGEQVRAEDLAVQLEALRDVEGRAGEIAAEALAALEVFSGMDGPRPSDERFRFDVRRVRQMADVRRALREPPLGEGIADGDPAGARAPGVEGARRRRREVPDGGATAATPSDPLDLEGKLRLLKHLHAERLISDEDYELKRRALLDQL